MADGQATAPFSNVKFVFLDRDGVINRKAPEGQYVCNQNDFHILPGVEAAISELNRLGRSVIVITNQRGIALGLFTCADVEALHAQFQRHLANIGAHVDAFYYCPHDKDRCNCRKPKTGLFENAFRDFPGANAENSIMIGDSLSDIEAARHLGLRSILIESDEESRRDGTKRAAALASANCSSLYDAVLSYLL
jgi:D-glycero-D-manno-heptose 1,7-bisphosphate phosphatase